MARSIHTHPYHLRLRLMSWITHMGYTPKRLKKLNRTITDHELPFLLLDCYECIGKLEEENAKLGLELTLAQKDLK